MVCRLVGTTSELTQDRNGETNEMQIDATYYLTGGYNINLRNPFLSIKPSALVRYDGTAWRGDVGCRLVYTHEKKMMYGGIAYSPSTSVTFLLGGVFHGVVLGYSYEVYTSVSILVMVAMSYLWVIRPTSTW